MSRRRVIAIAKLGVAGLLICWLVRSGSLNFGLLAIYVERPSLLVANLAVFVGTYLIAAARWQLLLRIAGIQLSYRRAVHLTFTGVFFNVVAPGNIGGDVVKVIYVARDLPPGQRPRVILVALLDRLLALAGLVAVAVVLTAGGRAVSEQRQLGEPTAAIAVLALVTLIIPVALIVIVRLSGDRLAAWTAGPSWLARLLARLVAAARLVSSRPRTLAVGLGLSIAIQLAGIVWFSAIASAVLDQDVAVARMATVYPVGMLSVLLPISYSGFGVGHFAFDELFAMVGLGGGANVLNVYLIGQIVPCLFGAIPYMLLKRAEGAPSAAELRDDAS